MYFTTMFVYLKYGSYLRKIERLFLLLVSSIQHINSNVEYRKRNQEGARSFKARIVSHDEYEYSRR